jgi:hypothetical protein
MVTTSCRFRFRSNPEWLRWRFIKAEGILKSSVISWHLSNAHFPVKTTASAGRSMLEIAPALGC